VAGKQAKILSEAQIRAALAYVASTRHASRNRVMVLLSVKAGLRAKEIASLTWSMVTEADGNVGDAIQLQDKAAKRRSGRTIPLNPDLRAALVALHAERRPAGDDAVIYSDRGRAMSAASVAVWFFELYKRLGFSGCSSHSGRRTFITRAARKIVEAGGSLRDVQELAGHRSLATTQRYIAGSTDAKRKLVTLI
jgi:integrase/recombinase XerD